MDAHSYEREVSDVRKMKEQLTILNITTSRVGISYHDGLPIGQHRIHVTKANDRRTRISLKLTYPGSTAKQLNPKLCHIAYIWLVPST